MTTIYPFKVLLINIGRWNTKSDDVLELICGIDLDVLDITFETKDEETLGDYPWMSKACKGRKVHGGIGFLVKLDLHPLFIKHILSR